MPMLKFVWSVLTTPRIRSTQYLKQAGQRGKHLTGMDREGMGGIINRVNLVHSWKEEFFADVQVITGPRRNVLGKGANKVGVVK